MGGPRPCLFCLFRGGWGGPELGKTCLYNTCALPEFIDMTMKVLSAGIKRESFIAGNMFY